jgi:hypothetical protein
VLVRWMSTGSLRCEDDTLYCDIAVSSGLALVIMDVESIT